MNITDLKKLLHYDQVTGNFTWLVTKRGAIKGTRAGCLHKTKWNVYRKITVLGEHFYEHNLAYFYMTEMLATGIDHIDLVGTNNAWSNLRLASSVQNNANQKIKISNTSGYKGVDWDKQKQKWRARLSHNNVRISIGFFDQKEDAASAYKKATQSINGEFARV